jgi:antagonist of KipI
VTALIRVLEGGLQTTVQDLGRRGHLRYGIPPSGPMDHLAFVLANRLAGNADGAAALECTLIGPRLTMTRPAVVAATGAEMPFTIDDREAPRWTAVVAPAGAVIRLGAAASGVRGYLAVDGGLDVPPVLGSRATYLRGRLGGGGGRALKKGDELALGAPSHRAATGGCACPCHAREGAAHVTTCCDQAPVGPWRRVRPDAIPIYRDEAEIRVVLGPQADRFTAGGIASFLQGPYEILPQSDRVGARLRGPVIEHARGHDIISDGIPLGGVQVVGDGQPIVLLVDRGSTGGYTKIATVCSFDIGRVGQLKPGQRLRFTEVTVEQAHSLLRGARRVLEEAIDIGGASHEPR